IDGQGDGTQGVDVGQGQGVITAPPVSGQGNIQRRRVGAASQRRDFEDDGRFGRCSVGVRRGAGCGQHWLQGGREGGGGGRNRCQRRLCCRASTGRQQYQTQQHQ